MSAEPRARRPRRPQTVFTQSLDRAVFGTYFLGAVVPLLGLAFLAQHYVLPGTDDAIGAISLVGSIVGVGVLSLLSFFALRRLVRGAIARRSADNDRLARLLTSSRELARAPHAQAAAQASAQHAAELTHCSDAAVLLRSSKSSALEVYASARDETRNLVDTHEALLFELAHAALECGGAAHLDGGAGKRSAPFARAVALPIAGADSAGGVLLLLDANRSADFGTECLSAVTTLASLAAIALENARLVDSQRNFFAHTTDLLTVAVDQHVRGREGHAGGVAALANRMGRELGLDEAELQNLHYASLLHDIGMLRIDADRHLNAAACRAHVQFGHRMLSRIQMWEAVAPIVLHHHESWDGSGYPEGLSGDAIPRAARIVAVADSVDAMRRAEDDRPGRDLAGVLAELDRCSGSQFDPEVVRAFRAVADRGELDL